VHTDSSDPAELEKDFAPDKEKANYRPRRREKHITELQDGMSAFGSDRAARDEWAERRKLADEREETTVQVGHYIAEVALTEDQGFQTEDLGEENEHLTIWGDRHKLAAAVCRSPYLAERTPT
jgi:hypothetical protein